MNLFYRIVREAFKITLNSVFKPHITRILRTMFKTQTDLLKIDYLILILSKKKKI